MVFQTITAMCTMFSPENVVRKAKCEWQVTSCIIGQAAFEEGSVPKDGELEALIAKCVTVYELYFKGD